MVHHRRDWLDQYHEQNRRWQQVLEPFRGELAQHLNELQLSYLANVMGECFDQFRTIYDDIFPALTQVRPDDFDALHDRVYEIGGLAGALTMIEEQIVAARPGFDVLLRLLADRATPPPTSPPAA